LLLAADGRILGCGASPVWGRACSRAAELLETCDPDGERPDMATLLEEARADAAEEIRFEKGRALVHD
ncbi:unnamed protein product, partial [marine sediment metagenome]